MKKGHLLILAMAGATLFASCDRDKANDSMKMMESTHTFMIENVSTPKPFVESGSFVGVGSEEVNLPVILPGQSINFKFKAGKGQALMFMTMYGASKDWFFASEQPGITLFNAQGEAITGDVSSQIKLWDNGTKNDESGEVEDMPIKEVPNIVASDLMHVSLSYEEVSSEFTLTIENVSGNTMHQTPFSPGVWAVSAYNGSNLLVEKPFFVPGEKSNSAVTKIAQGGDVSELKTMLDNETGIMTGVSPVVLVVYNGDKNPIFEVGKKDMEKGLKEVAQTGDATKLKSSLMSMNNVKGVYMAGTGPITPGQSAMVDYKISKNDKIAFVTMFGVSNDWFYANEQLLNADMLGDVTRYVSLFDSGTAVDQYPGAGNGQALFKGHSQEESKPIELVKSMYPVPAVNEVIRVTLK